MSQISEFGSFSEGLIRTSVWYWLFLGFFASSRTNRSASSTFTRSTPGPGMARTANEPSAVVLPGQKFEGIPLFFGRPVFFGRFSERFGLTLIEAQRRGPRPRGTDAFRGNSAPAVRVTKNCSNRLWSRKDLHPCLERTNAQYTSPSRTTEPTPFTRYRRKK